MAVVTVLNTNRKSQPLVGVAVRPPEVVETDSGMSFRHQCGATFKRVTDYLYCCVAGFGFVFREDCPAPGFRVISTPARRTGSERASMTDRQAGRCSLSGADRGCRSCRPVGYVAGPYDVIMTACQSTANGRDRHVTADVTDRTPLRMHICPLANSLLNTTLIRIIP